MIRKSTGIAKPAGKPAKGRRAGLLPKGVKVVPAPRSATLRRLRGPGTPTPPLGWGQMAPRTRLPHGPRVDPGRPEDRAAAGPVPVSMPDATGGSGAHDGRPGRGVARRE